LVKIVSFRILISIIDNNSLKKRKMANQMIQLTKMPQSAEEFEEMRNQMATTPEGGAAMFVLAMNGMLTDEPSPAIVVPSCCYRPKVLRPSVLFHKLISKYD
jgi:hypothetical protein